MARCGEVVYSIVVPQTRDLLLAARLVLREVLADRAGLERELDPPAGAVP